MAKTTLRRWLFIRRVQGLGFKLSEIKEPLEFTKDSLRSLARRCADAWKKNWLMFAGKTCRPSKAREHELRLALRSVQQRATQAARSLSNF